MVQMRSLLNDVVAQIYPVEYLHNSVHDFEPSVCFG